MAMASTDFGLKPPDGPSLAARVWDKISLYVVLLTAIAIMALALALWRSISVQNTLQQQSLAAQVNHHASTSSQLTTIHNDQTKIFNLTKGLDAVVNELGTLGQYLVASQVAVCATSGAQCPAVPSLPGITTTGYFFTGLGGI